MSADKKQNIFKTSRSNISRLHEYHFEILVILINAISIIIPLLWVSINTLIVYSIHDSIIGLMFLGIASVIFSFALYIAFKDKNILFNIGLLAGFIPLYLLVGFFNIFHIIIAVLNVIAIVVMIKVNKGRKKVKPQFKTKFGKIGLVTLILTLLIPVSFYFLLPLTPIPIEVEDNSADNIEINWTWAEDWSITEDELDALEYCNNLNDINVSITIALPEEYMEGPNDSIVINETLELYNRGITVDYMPLVPEKMGYYINDLTIDYYLSDTIEVFKDWVDNYNMSDKFRSIIIDTELYWSKRDESIFQWWDFETHNKGVEKLGDAIEEMRKIGEEEHPIACATFGMHLDEFVDFDDAQFQLFKLSIFPPWDWDMVGVMIYETGMGSEHSVWSSCNAIEYYFGDAGIPYIISTDNKYKRIVNKFKIIKNEGFEFCGIWSMTDFLYIKDYETGKKDKDKYSLKQFIELHEEINDHEGKIVIYYETLNHSAVHFALQFIDLWLFNRLIYDGEWPKIGKSID